VSLTFRSTQRLFRWQKANWIKRSNGQKYQKNSSSVFFLPKWLTFVLTIIIIIFPFACSNAIVRETFTHTHPLEKAFVSISFVLYWIGPICFSTNISCEPWITLFLGIISTTKLVKMIQHYIILTSCFVLLVGPANTLYSQTYKSSQIEIQNQLPFDCLESKCTLFR
jgi:hypothetical protein